MIPTLQTEHLTLRGPEARDWPAFRDYFASDRSRYTGGPAEDDKKSWILFAAEIGHWHLRGFGMWSVTLKDDTPIGLVGCWYPDLWPEQEIGWLMWDGYEGKGYAFEAATAARAQCYGPFGWPTAVSYIHRDNARSIALAKRLGCTQDTEAVHPNADALVFRHPSPAEVLA
ncbi:GNAT family N-acetyltransferase [Jannaschia sp. CCS1]|uniref:GNAT family N-acetyltransferase n=1 Tax=Jannaschia sp. (strain CCS1) TaxID=290400 RepID=UPI000053D3F5|nr:GNAT family N-acetyltransferase [Jannaschia sp. CCS1]ABD53669.1 GCN5-related N-acetyltransferase [Jannaschia sp. CCS1]